ncbi:hypothetical protein BGZ76_001440 [Entomortierella beljakovae]|nr:hypothetical protein BGZ76_001440 [Entomortierella beljakovae]
MHTLDRLVCSISTGLPFNTEIRIPMSIPRHRKGRECINAWKRFTKIITTPTRESQQCLLEYIRHLVIHDIQIIDAKLLDPLLPRLQNMRTIRLDYQTSGSIRLFPLLESAPLLESLTIKCDLRKTVYLLSDDSSDHWSSISSSIKYGLMAHGSQDVGTISLENPPPGVRFEEPRIRQEQHGLKYFNVTNVNILHHTLERLVMTCPGLLTLKVQDVNRVQSIYDEDGIELGTTRLGLYRTIILELCSKFCKELEWFHLSSFSKDDDTEGRHLELIRRFLPLKPRFLTRTFGKLHPSSLPPEPFLIQVYSSITVLRVHPMAGNPNFSSEYMSRFLCFLPSLLYLYAKDTDIYSKDLIHVGDDHCIDDSNSSAQNVASMSDAFGNDAASLFLDLSLYPSKSRPVRWACRWLKTLELRLAAEPMLTLNLFANHFVKYCPSITCLKLVMSDLTMGRYIGIAGKSGFIRGEPEIKSLVGLELLEEITVSAQHINGTLDAKDMEFMRPKVHTREAGKGNTSYTVWPRLVAFNIHYCYPEKLDDCIKFEEELGAMRPGVEFRIRKMSYR